MRTLWLTAGIWAAAAVLASCTGEAVLAAIAGAGAGSNAVLALKGAS